MSFESDAGVDYCGGPMTRGAQMFTVVGTHEISGTYIGWIRAMSINEARKAVQPKVATIIAIFPGFIVPLQTLS